MDVVVLADWQGKSEDIPISYDIQVDTQLALPVGGSNGLFVDGQDVEDLGDVQWDRSVSAVDKSDYQMAVACGVIAATVDSFFVGEFSLERANRWGAEQVNSFVLMMAKSVGYKYDDLAGAIQCLERKFGMASDGVMSDFGGARQHHLRDFSHHFSLLGLVCSILTQATGYVIGTNEHGALITRKITDSPLLGNTFEEKIVLGVVDWFYHMASDMAGSSSNAGGGTGIPGPLLSLVKEISALPCFKSGYRDETAFRNWVSKLFNGTLLGEKFNLRTEIGMLHELGRQAIPVVINECLVRSCYFTSRLFRELKKAEILNVEAFRAVDISRVLPFNSRAISRMVTVATGTFTVLDGADAVARALVKNRGVGDAFWSDCALRINFVGIGRFAFAVRTDVRSVREDARHAKFESESGDRQNSELSVGLQDWVISADQFRVLCSIQQLVIDYDIARSPRNSGPKALWRVEWVHELLDELAVPAHERSTYLLTESQLLGQIDSELSAGRDDNWLYLIAMEAALFSPYYPLNSPHDHRYKSLVLNADYLTDVFGVRYPSVGPKVLASMRKSFKKYEGVIGGGRTRRALGAVGTTAAVAVAGGVAFVFAPVIAPVIAATAFGGALTGLSGAALTSASLAAIGGGSLAVGGLGMAGGTAIITGGGALLGAAGGLGTSALASMASDSGEGLVIHECSKFLTFCDVVLARRPDAARSLSAASEWLSGGISGMLEPSLEMINSSDAADVRKDPQYIQLMKTLKYLERCAVELSKLSSAS